MRQRHQRPRDRLAVFETAPGALVLVTGDPVGERRGDAGGQAGDERSDDGRQQDLGDHHGEVHARGAGADQDGADQTAEQGMRGTRRQAVQPGQQVPQDGPDETAEHHGRGDERFVDQPAGDRLRDLRGQERPRDVEHRGQQDRSTRLERSGGHRGGHGVRAVVEAVGEVEHQGGDHHHDDDEQGGGHAVTSGSGSTPGNCSSRYCRNVARNPADRCPSGHYARRGDGDRTSGACGDPPQRPTDRRQVPVTVDRWSSDAS